MVILLTDGEPTCGREMNSNKPFSLEQSTLGHGSTEDLTNNEAGRQANSKIIWSNIKTSYLSKEKLAEVYGTEVFYYTIGLGITTNYGTFMLNPTGTNLAVLNNSSEDVDLDLAEFMSDKSKYNYVTKAFIGEMTEGELKSYFKEIATQVTEATIITEVCITVQQLYDEGYLSKKDIKMADGQASSTYVIMSYNEPTNQYNFSLARTEKQKNVCESLLASS